MSDTTEQPATACQCSQEGKCEEGGEKSERQGGIRKVRGRSELETVWKREGSALKEVILKGAPREWTGRSQRGGGEVKPPHHFFLPVHSFARNMGNRGSREQQENEGRCREREFALCGFYLGRLLYLGTVF